MLDVFTLIKHVNHQYMVRVMDFKESPKQHISYIDYVNKTNTQQYAQNLSSSRSFVLMKREDEDSNILTEGERSFGKLYLNSLPQISPDNRVICMPRFTNATHQNDSSHADEDIIDVYDCSKLEFWSDWAAVDITDNYFKLSLKLRKDSHKNFQTIHFSPSNKVLAVQCTDELFVYRLEPAGGGTL